MDTILSSPDDIPFQENLPLRHRKTRVNDAEKIRQDFIRSRQLMIPPKNGTPSPTDKQHDEH